MLVMFSKLSLDSIQGFFLRDSWGRVTQSLTHAKLVLTVCAQKFYLLLHVLPPVSKPKVYKLDGSVQGYCVQLVIFEVARNMSNPQWDWVVAAIRVFEVITAGQWMWCLKIYSNLTWVSMSLPVSLRSGLDDFDTMCATLWLESLWPQNRQQKKPSLSTEFVSFLSHALSIQGFWISQVWC